MAKRNWKQYKKQKTTRLFTGLTANTTDYITIDTSNWNWTNTAVSTGLQWVDANGPVSHGNITFDSETNRYKVYYNGRWIDMIEVDPLPISTENHNPYILSGINNG